jgi:hypothetical protein
LLPRENLKEAERDFTLSTTETLFKQRERDQENYLFEIFSLVRALLEVKVGVLCMVFLFYLT